MKKIKKICIVLIAIVLMILSAQIVIANEENIIKSTWHIDTNLDEPFLVKNGVHIEGWAISTVSNTKLEVSIDGKEVDSNCIKYSYKYDLISIVKGYGTYTENPTPNFDIDIPVADLKVGKHTLKIEFKTLDDSQVLQSLEKDIQITKDIKHVLTVDTNLNNATFGKSGIEITGWKLATEANTKLVATVDGEVIQGTTIDMYYAYDLISIVKGYGTYEENPEPNYSIHIPTDTIKQGKYKLKIQFLTYDDMILESVEKEINIDKSIKHVLTIDTYLDGTIFDKKGIEITGWKLATEPDTKLEATIDGCSVEGTTIDMYYAYDLISIVKGYGTYEENPTPNFTIRIPVENLKGGTHKIDIKFLTKDGTILDEVNESIMIDKSIKHILNIDTALENQAWTPNGIQIEGWKLATEANTTINVFINDRKVENIEATYEYRYDLISIVKGYGTYEENPTPNFSLYIPINEFKSGDNYLKLQMVTEQGEMLEEKIYNIVESKTRIQIEKPYDRTTITNENHSIAGWIMTTAPDTTVKLLIDGHHRSEETKRVERQDVLNAIKDYGDVTTNSLPGFDISIDFSEFSLGLHQIAIRVEKGDGKIIGEQVIYIFLRQSITYEEGTYGESGLLKAGNQYGSKLQYYRYGDGPNVFFATFSVHGFEDNWEHDGEALVNIANKFYEELKRNHNANYDLADKWTIYILPEINPDGRKYGTTNNGPGRTTLYSQAPNNKGIDLNRCWKTSGFNANENSRNYAGTAPYQAYEAQALRDFLQSHKSQNGQTVLVDLHGWLQQLIGNREIGMYYAVQFPENHGRSLDKYGDGYIIDWARTALASNGKLAKTALIELTKNVYSLKDVENQKLAERYIQATLSMLHGVN